MANVPEKSDPFTSHLNACLSKTDLNDLSSKESWSTSSSIWPTLGKMKWQCPTKRLTKAPKKPNVKRKRLTLSNEHGDDSCHDSQTEFGRVLSDAVSAMTELPLCSNILSNVPELSSMELELLSVLTNYTDMYYPEAGYKKWEEVIRAYCIHAVNHILKSRARILKNNAELSEVDKAEVDLGKYKDQGFARPKVLILLPSKNAAYR